MNSKFLKKYQDKPF